MASAARNELIPVFVEEPETSVSSDFPETDADDLFQMPDKSSWDPSVSGKREEQHKDEKDGQSSCVPDVVITEADEGKLCHCSQVTKSHISSKRLALDVDNDGENAVYDLRQDKSSDMQSLKSEPGSLASEILASASLKSDIDQDVIDDELRSMATSSVTSFFQRLQLDPLERAWLQFAAIGNPAALTRLVLQDPTLTSKKVQQSLQIKNEMCFLWRLQEKFAIHILTDKPY
ncbi:uncharacterized protein LOC122810404 [Protopterus annectens]|uniref:uncharacterized protein LOC122810404 n=1 Tax=Protopterus annectens TaxID=7888 RepID=UPI001CF96F4F|nr:uncharacterized protein LOC122810404 [Protopterus annectens]